MASHINSQFIVSPNAHPTIKYLVTYSAERLEGGDALFRFTVDTYLGAYAKFGTGYSLKCDISVGGAVGEAILKETADSWSNTSYSYDRLMSRRGIEVRCSAPAGGTAMPVGFAVTRPDGQGSSGIVESSDYYVISPQELYTSAGGARVTGISVSEDNELVIDTEFGADGLNNPVSDVHVYGNIGPTDRLPNPLSFDFASGKGTVSGRSKRFALPLPTDKSPFEVKVRAYSISAREDNPPGDTVDSGLLYRYDLLTLDGGETLKMRVATTRHWNIHGHIPSREGYSFLGFFTAEGEQVYSAEGIALGEGKYFRNDNTEETDDRYFWVYGGDITLYPHWKRDTFAYMKTPDGWKPAELFVRTDDGWRRATKIHIL